MKNKIKFYCWGQYNIETETINNFTLSSNEKLDLNIDEKMYPLLFGAFKWVRIPGYDVEIDAPLFKL